MAKSRPFSIYLLKEGVSIDDALVDNHNLEQLIPGNIENNRLPEGVTIFLSSSHSTPPWWKEYMHIAKPLNLKQEGALVFINCSVGENMQRIFALTFGMTYHKLKEGKFEYDFGIRTTLNAIDPEKIKTTETLQPDNAKRQRLQSPVADTLNFFDFNRDQSIVKTLSGKVKDDFSSLFKSVTGVSSLKITSYMTFEELPRLCSNLYDIYNQETFMQIFPDLQNIVPVKDPTIKQELEAIFIEGYNTNNNRIIVTIPEMLIEPQWNKYQYIYKRKLSGQIDENDINELKRILPEAESIDDFRKARLRVLDENLCKQREYSFENCVLFDCTYDNKTFHFCEGCWYCIEEDYLNRINTTLSSCLENALQHNLPNYNHSNEGAYNLDVPNQCQNFTCLDTLDISPNGQKQVEPCDLIKTVGDKLQLYHIKIGTRSSTLSHLFNQGAVSIDLLLSERESRNKLKQLLNNDAFTNSIIDNRNFSIIFGVVTHRDINEGIELLPLFSRISLYRVAKSLETKRINWSIVFIPKA